MILKCKEKLKCIKPRFEIWNKIPIFNTITLTITIYSAPLFSKQETTHLDVHVHVYTHVIHVKHNRETVLPTSFFGAWVYTVDAFYA